jgi:hypothetical protein
MYISGMDCTLCGTPEAPAFRAPSVQQSGLSVPGYAHRR